VHTNKIRAVNTGSNITLQYLSNNVIETTKLCNIYLAWWISLWRVQRIYSFSSFYLGFVFERLWNRSNAIFPAISASDWPRRLTPPDCIISQIKIPHFHFSYYKQHLLPQLRYLLSHYAAAHEYENRICIINIKYKSIKMNYIISIIILFDLVPSSNNNIYNKY